MKSRIDFGFIALMFSAFSLFQLAMIKTEVADLQEFLIDALEYEGPIAHQSPIRLVGTAHAEETPATTAPAVKPAEKKEGEKPLRLCVHQEDDIRFLNAPAHQFPTGQQINQRKRANDGGPDFDFVWPPVPPSAADPHWWFLFIRKGPFNYLAEKCPVDANPEAKEKAN